MPIYFLKRSDECMWALMTTVTSLQSATSKAAKLRTGTRFSTDSSPDLGDTYALDFGDT
jgi:hypothetical protein